MSDQTEIRKAAMREAMLKSLGNISAACKIAKVSRQTFYTWKKEDPEFLQMIKDIKEESKDFAESKLFELINGIKTVETTTRYTKDLETGVITSEVTTVKEVTAKPNVTAAIFFLKTQAKDRGYIERQELLTVAGDDFNKEMDRMIEKGEIPDFTNLHPDDFNRLNAILRSEGGQGHDDGSSPESSE